MPHSLHLSKLLTCGLTLVLASTPSLPVIACLSSDAQTTPAPYLQITLHTTYYHGPCLYGKGQPGSCIDSPTSWTYRSYHRILLAAFILCLLGWPGLHSLESLSLNGFQGNLGHTFHQGHTSHQISFPEGRGRVSLFPFWLESKAVLICVSVAQLRWLCMLTSYSGHSSPIPSSDLNCHGGHKGQWPAAPYPWVSFSATCCLDLAF